MGSAVWRLDSGRAAAPRPPDGAEAGPSVADWITGPSVADWITGLSPAKLLALVGGGALLLAMALFLSLAFSRGWITPEMRVALGLLVGFGMLPAGALLFDRERPTLGHVVAGVGLGTIELALFASRLYELVPAEVALLAALTAAICAGVIAVHWNSQLLAGMGIAAVLAAPPVVAAPANLLTVCFLGAVMVGVVYVSLRRDWEWLPWLSLGLTAPQVLAWVYPGSAEPALVVMVLGGYWALFSTAGVLPVLIGAPRPLPMPIAMLGATSAFVVVAAYLGIDPVALRGALIGALGLANLAIGIGLARRRGLEDTLALTALGLALTLYVIAVALLLDGPGIPIAWTLSMVCSAWVWARLRVTPAPYAAIAVGLLTAGRLLLVEYHLDSSAFSASGSPQAIPYADPEGIALAVYLAGLAVAGWLSRQTYTQQAIAAGAALLLAATVPLEAEDIANNIQAPMIVLGWMAIALAALAADRLWHPKWQPIVAGHFLPMAGWIVAGIALVDLGARFDLFRFAGPPTIPATPFTDEQSLIALTVVIATWLVALTRVDQLERIATICVSLLVVAALMRQQLALEWAVAGWSLLAVGSMVGAPSHGLTGRVADVTAGLLLTAGVVATLFVVAPPSRLAVRLSIAGIGAGPPNGATVAIGAVALGLAIATWREQRTFGTRWLGLAVLGAVIYGLSVGLVDSFAARVPGRAELEEIATQAQVALTILWAAIGLGLLGFGLMRDSSIARGAGLAVFGLATAKAFIYDLAALDIAYRVLSLLGLGLLLLAGAYAYQRMRTSSDDHHTQPGADAPV